MEPLYSPQSRAERLIAAGRVVLAISALFAIWFDPSEPVNLARIAYSLLVAYVVYAVGIAVLVWRSDAPSERQRWITQAVDLVFFSFFLYFTVGTANPFIAYFTFAVVCAALRWQWRGALWVAAASLACFLGIGLYLAVTGTPGFDLYPLIVRGIYLALIAVLVGYMGFHEERTRRDVSLLAAWPHESSPEAGPLVRSLLEHAARTLDAPRAVLAWVEKEEPWLYIAALEGLEGGTFSWTRSPGDPALLVAEPLQGKGFLCPDAASPRPEVLRRGQAGMARWQGSPLDPGLQERFGIRSVLALAVRGESVEGWLFLLDRNDMTSDDLLLGEIAAGVVASRLDHFYLGRRLQEAVAMEERIRLSRDLHDGVLQSLTGIGLRLAAVRGLMEENPQAARASLEAVQRLLTLEQRDLRFFIQELKPRPRPAGEVSLAFRVIELIQRIEMEWGLRADLRIEGLEDPIPEPLAREVYHLVREALVNAARHGEASAVRLAIRRAPGGQLSITVADNGRGFPFEGRLSHAALAQGNVGPRNLFERVSSLRGTLDVESGPSGARLEIALPGIGA